MSAGESGYFSSPRSQSYSGGLGGDNDCRRRIQKVQGPGPCKNWLFGCFTHSKGVSLETVEYEKAKKTVTLTKIDALTSHGTISTVILLLILCSTKLSSVSFCRLTTKEIIRHHRTELSYLLLGARSRILSPGAVRSSPRRTITSGP